MDSSLGEPPTSSLSLLLQVTLTVPVQELLLMLGIIVLLLICSALISASEVAFFSMSKSIHDQLVQSDQPRDRLIVHLLDHPKKLLASLLIANNLVNVSIVIISYYIVAEQFDISAYPLLGFLIQTLLVTLLIVMFGEVVPKVYATEKNLQVAAFMAPALNVMNKVFAPFNWLLISGTDLIDRRMKNKVQNVSMDELNQAIELTYEEEAEKTEEKDILKGIVNFGNISVKQVMTPRQDIQAVDSDLSFTELLAFVTESGYSRVPVYTESLDKINGILYLKDLLPHLDKDNHFDWSGLLRKPFFIPEKKRIDDLFKDFQTKHTHMAIVVDEYGGCAGLITLEDILEEIVGEINDEFDEAEQLPYQQLDERNYLFEAKVQLQELFKHLNIDEDLFEDVRGEADSLAGLILELSGHMPVPGEEILHAGFVFTVVEADDRRIISVKLTLPEAAHDEQDESRTTPDI